MYLSIFITNFMCFSITNILKAKFIKHNKVNYSCYDVKYFDLYLSLNFLQHLRIRLIFYFVIVFF